MRYDVEMSYSRSTEKIKALLSSILASPEIADEIERKALRRSAIEEETLGHAAAIWESVSSRVESYDLTEQTILSVSQRHKIPSPPPHLTWINRTSWLLLTALLVLGAMGATLGFLRGWRTAESLLLHIGSWRMWGFALTNVLLIFTALRVWYLRARRIVESSVNAAKASLDAELKPLKIQLKTEERQAEESLHQAVTSQVREIIAGKSAEHFGVSLPDGNPDGLSQVQNPELDIATPAGNRLKRIIEAVSGASIGISGPRGAGKTTLLWSNYQIGNTKPNVLSIFTSAPVEYDAREFVLHLFASVCSRIIEKAVGRQDVLAKRKRSFEYDEEEYSRARRYRSPLAMLTRRPLFLSGTTLLYASLILAFFKVEAIRTPRPSANPQNPPSMVIAWMTALDLKPGILFGSGAILLIFGFFAEPYLHALRERTLRDKSTSRGDPQDLEYEEALEKKGPLVLNAYYQLSNIRFQQSYTSGWSGSLKLPLALEGSMKSDRSWSERQRTLPDIVDEYRRFLDQVVGSKENPYERVFICIDELDKLESDEAAQRFLNGIKSVFGQVKCYYMVSVSENAMSSFERRGLPIRDAFDSSFDEVIHVEFQSLSSSKRLLSRRVLNLPDPFLCFCHVLAGGLPRDLIRACRALFDARVSGAQNTISAICGRVLSTDLQMKLRAIAVAAEQESDLPKDFINHILSQSLSSADEIWALISRLQADQRDGLRKGNEVASGPLSEGERSNMSLPMETLLLVFFYATAFEIFERMDETIWRKGESDGLFEGMAAIRRGLSQTPSVVANSIETIRVAFGLRPSQECLSSTAKRGA